jgi:rhodanese-related sulfurtransferase
VFLDVRSTIEYYFVGHPVGAIHVAWNDGEDWETNPHFVGEVSRLVGGDHARPVVLICRSGHRSIEAGNALEAAGFVDVVNVLHGFEGERDEEMHRNTLSGWRVDGLPWEQS